MAPIKKNPYTLNHSLQTHITYGSTDIYCTHIVIPAVSGAVGKAVLATAKCST